MPRHRPGISKSPLPPQANAAGTSSVAKSESAVPRDAWVLAGLLMAANSLALVDRQILSLGAIFSPLALMLLFLAWRETASGAVE